MWGPFAALVLCLASSTTLILHLWHTARESLLWIGPSYLTAITAELLYSERRLLRF